MAYSINYYRRWANGRCQLKVNGFGVPEEWSTLVQKAIDTWNQAGANFKFVVDPLSPSSIQCDEIGVNGWVATTTLDPTDEMSPISAVLIKLNTLYPFDPPHSTRKPMVNSEPYDLYTVLLHELGHALHLGEDRSGSDTVMCPTLVPGETRTLAQDDVNGIKLLYP